MKNIGFSFFLGVFLTGIVVVFYTHITDERGKHMVAWNVYRGTVQTATGNYNVEISEDDRGYGMRRLVHLYPAGKPSYYTITGHDYATGKWDRVFYCGKHALVRSWTSAELGCNSVLRTNNGWNFEPCDADKDNVMPFSTEAIDFAVEELNTAVSQIYNPEHIVSQWKWDAKQKKAVEFYHRS
ncbi:MAG: hypothetical protein QG589_342 [Patescibacteria group bacterium]|nr:hypothetical protein [Patescibacteria group bacterium]